MLSKRFAYTLIHLCRKTLRVFLHCSIKPNLEPEQLTANNVKPNEPSPWINVMLLQTLFEKNNYEDRNFFSRNDTRLRYFQAIRVKTKLVKVYLWLFFIQTTYNTHLMKWNIKPSSYSLVFTCLHFIPCYL